VNGVVINEDPIRAIFIHATTGLECDTLHGVSRTSARFM
jgi:hypothetical protein